MDEFGETPSFYIWPAGHEDGTPFPDDTLRAAGFESETV